MQYNRNGKRYHKGEIKGVYNHGKRKNQENSRIS